MRVNVATTFGSHDKRYSTDRRFNKQLSIKHFILGGKRRKLRRATDKQGIKFVDAYDPALMGFIILLLILSILDGFMTLHLLNHGAREINPIMSSCLESGPWFFLSSKFLLTCFGAMCLLVVSNSYVFGNRLHVRDIFPAMLVLYLMMIVWDSFLYIIV
jgi:hypothetical protein